ncbi:MAG TPA: carbonic anhydrase [Lacipirellulaceae bacterium]|jgi:carbonic anhydrase
MEEIIAGVRAFQRDVYPQYRERFAELATGQSPQAMVITCSDSRVDPFLLTQSEPGQLFVLRNAGNIVPEHDGFVGGVTATIEFAVVQLRVPNIIICGHAGCGAVAGLLHPEKIRHLPEVTNWLHHAARARKRVAESGGLEAPDAMERAVEANVVVQLENLRTHPCVAEALDEGRIALHGWVYDFITGSVLAYKHREQVFAPLGE